MTGRLFNYLRTETGGTLVFSTTATESQLGDLVRKFTNGTFEYRSADGSLMRFDSSGRVTAIVDRNNNTTVLAYSGGNLTQITDPVGRSVILTYDGSGRISRATDPLGRAWSYAYEGEPSLTRVTDPLNQVMRYKYVVGGRLSKVIDKRGNAMKEIFYDSNSRVSEQRYAEGGFEQYSYTLSGTVVTSVTVTDSLGRSTSRRFNANGYVIEMTDTLGQRARIERDIATGLPVSTIGPCGCAESTREFDGRGNVTAVTNRLGQTVRFVYEATFNNVISITDNEGRVSRLGYDSHGNLASVTDALSQVTTFAYDAFGQLISSTDPLGHTTRLEYNAHGNVYLLRLMR